MLLSIGLIILSGLLLGCGNIVLTMAVISIVITAPLGALGMDATMHKYISNDKIE